MANFVNRSDLEKQITKARLIQLFDDDGDGLVEGDDAEALAECMAEASAIVTNHLVGKGFDVEQLNGLSRDRGLRRAACNIAAEIAGPRRPEFINPQTGAGPYDAMGQRGREYLKEFAKGALRSRLEDQHGKNATVRGALSYPTPKFIFSRDPSDPNDNGPGGF